MALSRKVFCITIMVLTLGILASAGVAAPKGAAVPKWKTELEAVRKTLEAEDQNLKTQITDGDQSVRAEVDALKSSFNQSNKRLESRIEALESTLATTSSKIDEQANLLTGAERINTELRTAADKKARTDAAVAWISLVALVLGVIGTTLMASEILLAEVKAITSLAIKPPLRDLGTVDEPQRAITGFLSLVGLLLLFSSFVVQLVAILMGRNGSELGQAIVCLLVMGFSASVMWHYAGKTWGQTRKEKVALLWRNISRNLLLPLWIFRNRNSTQCDVCGNRTQISEGRVCWIEETNSTTDPYLYQPHKFAFLHAQCISALPAFKKIEQYLARRHIIRTPMIRNASMSEFASVEYPRLRAFFKSHGEYWMRERQSDSVESHHEEELAELAGRLRIAKP